MKRIIFSTLLLFVTSIIIAEENTKHQIINYYIGKENVTNTVSFAVMKLNYRSVTTPYHTKDTIYGLEIELYKTGNNKPVEKIILKNGTVGGNRIYFDEAVFSNGTNSKQKFIANYGETLSDEEPAVYVIWIYEADNIGPNTEVITLIIEK